MATEDSIPAEQIDTEKETQDMEDLIRSMKVTKSRAKGNFTRQKNSLYRLIENNESSSAISNSKDRLDELAQSVMDSISELIKKVGKGQADALVQELEIFEQEYNKTVSKIEEKLTPSTVSNTVVSPAPTTGLQYDLMKQLSPFQSSMETNTYMKAGKLLSQPVWITHHQPQSTGCYS